jgi:hypothetical protein
MYFELQSLDRYSTHFERRSTIALNDRNADVFRLSHGLEVTVDIGITTSLSIVCVISWLKTWRKSMDCLWDSLARFTRASDAQKTEFVVG